MNQQFDDTLPQPANEATPQTAALSGERLVVRADGDARIGIGHVMRCLALVQAWIAAGGMARLACTAVPPTVAERYFAVGAEVLLREEWLAGDVLDGADAVVADGMHFSDAELAALADGPAPLVLIDDMGHRAAYPGRLLLNQNLHAAAGLYRGKTAARLCLGPDWCLLRRDFQAIGANERLVPERVGTILILMGGADPHGFSALALDAVARAVEWAEGDPEIRLVVGAANPAIDALSRRASTLPARITIHHDVRDMAGLMADADLAVSASGSTVWELASLGVPMVIGAQNPTEIGPGQAMQNRGAARYVGPLDQLDAETLTQAVSHLAADVDARREMSAAARTLVDGRGADRLAAAIATAMRDHVSRA